MLVTDKIVYLQMQKAGSTQATIILRRYCGGQTEEKHSQLKDRHRYGSRLIVSSIRNPWEWYVSQWAFGCTGHGELRRYFDNLPRSEIRQALKYSDFGSVLRFPIRTLLGRPDWKRLYSDPSNDQNFRDWLKLILGAEGLHISSQAYASSPIKRAAGLMTYLYLGLTTDYAEWMRTGRKCRTYDEVSAFADKHSIVNQVLRVETLNEDLLNLLGTIGVDVPPTEGAQWGKKNASFRRTSPEYYDEETAQLVASRDRFIIDRFGYAPLAPGTQGSAERH
jgi:hypothetical protein